MTSTIKTVADDNFANQNAITYTSLVNWQEQHNKVEHLLSITNKELQVASPSIGNNIFLNNFPIISTVGGGFMALTIALVNSYSPFFMTIIGLILGFGLGKVLSDKVLIPYSENKITNYSFYADSDSLFMVQEKDQVVSVEEFSRKQIGSMHLETAPQMLPYPTAALVIRLKPKGSWKFLITANGTNAVPNLKNIESKLLTWLKEA